MVGLMLPDSGQKTLSGLFQRLSGGVAQSHDRFLGTSHGDADPGEVIAPADPRLRRPPRGAGSICGCKPVGEGVYFPHTRNGGATVSTEGWKRRLHVEVDRLAS